MLERAATLTLHATEQAEVDRMADTWADLHDDLDPVHAQAWDLWRSLPDGPDRDVAWAVLKGVTAAMKALQAAMGLGVKPPACRSADDAWPPRRRPSP